MELLTDITLFLVYMLLALGGLHQFITRHTCDSWFYLSYALAFICMMVGIWPGFAIASQWGFMLLLIGAGLQIALNILLALFERQGMDIRSNDLAKHQ